MGDAFNVAIGIRISSIHHKLYLSVSVVRQTATVTPLLKFLDVWRNCAEYFGTNIF